MFDDDDDREIPTKPLGRDLIEWALEAERAAQREAAAERGAMALCAGDAMHGVMAFGEPVK